MRWVADECVDAGLVRRLRGAGHEVLYVAEIAPRSVDVQVLQRAEDENRILLTEDKGFGELVLRLRMMVPGLVLLRIGPERHILKWTRLESAVQRFGQRLFGRYLVIEEARFRSRPLLRSTPASRG